MKYSFLLPTRLRTQTCIQSIGSIYEKSSNKNIFEILLAFDEDDETRHEIIEYCQTNHIHHSVLVTKRYGYDNLHAYVNQLCTISKGEYVWLWNDDAYMETQNWDVILETHTREHPDLAYDFTNGFPFIFPLVPKKYIDAMKHFSLNAHNDTWIELILKPFNLTMVIPEIRIFHNRHEGDGNSMGVNYDDVNKSVLKTSPEFFSPFCTLLRQVDQNRIARNFPNLSLPTTKLPHEKNRIGFVGMGKLGLPVAVGIANKGHFVLGYDINPDYDEYTTISKVFTEHEASPDGTGVIGDLLDQKNLKLTKDLELVVEFSEIIFIAVQTPHDPLYEGITRVPDSVCNFNYAYLEKAIIDVVQICDRLQLSRTIVIISTVLPGTMRKILPQSNYVSYCYNPFFIAMGTVLQDFYYPEFILLGGNDKEANNRVIEFYKTITSSQVFHTSIESAELIKVSYNTMISMKLAFVNQLMEICDHIPGTNIDDVTNALKLSNKRLISPAYLTAGMGDGGGCHPRDNIAMSWLAKELGLKIDFCAFIMNAREKQTEFLSDLCLKYASEHQLKIIILGKAFKPNIRLSTGSPSILLYNLIKEKDTTVEIYEDMPESAVASVFFIGTKHDRFISLHFPKGSIVIDPNRYIPKHEDYYVYYVGKHEVS